VSYFSSTRLEEIAAQAPKNCRKWAQVYFKPNKTNNVEFIHHAEKHGFEAIVMTIDSTNYGRPYRQLRNSILVQRSVPPANIPVSETYEPFVDPELTWDHLNWLRNVTKLPIVVRGIINPLDAAAACRYGADAVYVSNHGGRQLDTVSASIDILSDTVQVVRHWNANQGKDKPKIDVYFDGGVRSGLDALKAYAMGAQMVFLGRPTLWGLAVNGTDGIMDVFDSTVAELTNAMQLAGFPVLEQVDLSLLQQPTLQESIAALDKEPNPQKTRPERKVESKARNDAFSRIVKL
jgi:isopentenyl diphosphate isomerase/L-lactate dehydrogenase-like FMN-dependent dehydrogenase